ncbi:MAG: CNNM domain-containing protein [Kiritimatiellae bacterium]|nr:CNNM domain-containing protein [Kiritimatiellia bacterium]
MIVLEVMALLVALLGSAFFAGIETGVIAMNRLRLRHLVQHRVRGAAEIEAMLERPDVLLGTTLVGTNLCHVTMAVVASHLAVRAGWRWAEAIAGAVVTLVLLVFGEYVPKAWFQAFPTHRVLPWARLLRAASVVLLPARVVLAAIVRPFLRPAAPAASAAPLLTRDEFVHLAHEGRQSGILSPVEANMITGVIRIGGIRCRDIMRPIEQATVVPKGMPVPELLAIARTTDFSRFPVRDPNSGEIVGVVNIYDVLSDADAERRTVDHYMRRPQLVAEHTIADHVMPRMRVTRQPLMLVADEGGRVTGILTLEDVLAIMVGQPKAAPA